MRVRVLDPTAAAPETAPVTEPDAGTVAGKVVGIRLDRAWRSFEWVADEWRQTFAALGATVKLWVAGSRVGEEGERTRAELEAFADGVDVAVVGLGN